MWNIGFRDQHYMRGYHIQNRTKQFDHHVGLRKVDASSPFFFPKISDGIEPQNISPILDIDQHDAQHRQQNINAFKIQIHLILTEGGPEMHHATIFFGERRQQGKRPRPGHHGQIFGRIHFNR